MSIFKVLLVDDEREYVTTLGERMQMRGLDPEIAFSGEQALRMLEHSLPDVMVLDLKMPGIDGLEVLRRVKKRYPQIQVIILTGHGSDRDEAAARRLGAFDHLQKPVDINDLVHIMELAFHQKAEPGKPL
jgi:DNA-binding response OmpR family regulator